MTLFSVSLVHPREPRARKRWVERFVVMAADRDGALAALEAERRYSPSTNYAEVRVEGQDSPVVARLSRMED